MWYGEYIHTLDDKERFVLPSKFRRLIKEKKLKTFYLTRGLDKCLFMYPEEEWQRQVEKLRTLPNTKREVRSFHRMFLSGAQGVDVDSQGRILLPLHLKNFAGIQKEIVIIGVADRIEIWDKKEWERFYEVNKGSFEEIAEHLVE